ncbi:putative negative regulation of gluconeogenesis-related protein [Dioszegia hungarica]|uniref:Negative regulation of gluconeogenesis-related protein n=1 Tax=Dioszegia hungarica TaxID=4972 RepID=A0AA38HGL9_9TREE|nr:putative negative regulation of gluconeogenesis-related protein [Dioszegia hungarica]KAI9639768.1 putative negative regulation of gluconeogenesis-related protein [Dioszegia hungarica]
MAPATATNSALILEEPFIRTPYELLRRSHRSAQRQVEKDFTAVQTTLQALLKSLGSKGNTNDSRAAALSKVDQSGERLRGLKRKLDDLQPSSSAPSPLRSRAEYLSRQLEPARASRGMMETGAGAADGDDAMAEVRETAGEGGAEDIAMEDADVVTPEWKDNTLDRYIVDYLLRTGRMKTAQALADRQGLDQLVDLKLFAELTKIENALVEKQSVVEALAWCGENRGTLKKTKNNLEFTLRMQDFIELCRKRDIVGAIAYSRKNLSAWAPTHMGEIQQGMTLLAFGEKTGVGSYRKLYDRSRWEAVRREFRQTFLTLYALPSQPVLSLALCAGLSALRLPSCARHQPPQSPLVPLLPAGPPLHNFEEALLPDLDVSFPHLTAPIGGVPSSASEDLHEHPEQAVGNVDCPTCGADMKALAKEVPMSHHVNSTIVCRISGEVMDSNNEPLAFPNGYVYSSKALAEMAKNSFDVVTCPRTRESCAFSRLRKVYIS